MGVAIGGRVDDDLQALAALWLRRQAELRTSIEGADVSSGIARGPAACDLVKFAFVVA